MTKIFSCIFQLVVLLFFSFSTVAQKGFVQRDGDILRDSKGRMLQLKGLNYVNKDKVNRFRNLIKDTAFREMKSWGYNAVRLGINWSALEPEPGKYDQSYLKDLDNRLKYAKQYGIYVILDMHQDLYGEKFGGGAPLWATLDENKPHITGGIWSDAYYISPAVQTSFDNFWNNSKAADGIGVQDHYVKTWAMLAERYKNDKNIIGFDVMNEPFAGSPVNLAMGVMLSEVTESLNKNKKDKTYTLEEVGALWMDENGKNFIIKQLTGKDVFFKVLKGMEPIYKDFEENKLMPFYKILAIAVRAVNNNHFLFWEPSVSTNNGIPTYIREVKEAGKNQGLMPHFYDIVLDTKDAGEADAGRLGFMFSQLAKTKKETGLPMFIGEWGAFYTGGREVLNAAHIMTTGMDSLLIGDFYWDYFRGMGSLPVFKEELNRAYVQAVAGRLTYQKAAKNSLQISWLEDKNAKDKTIIYVPGSKNIKVYGKAVYGKAAIKNGSGTILSVATSGINMARELTISWSE